MSHEVCTPQLSGRQGHRGRDGSTVVAGKTPTPSAPPPPLCAQTDTQPHQDTRRRPSYSHSVTAGTGPSGLKRGGAKTLHGTGETVYKRKVDSTALRGGAGETWGKLRQGKTLQQPSTQSDLESRPTGQAPGSRSKLLPEAAARLPALGATRQEPRSQSGRREAGKGGGSAGIHTWPPLSGPCETQTPTAFFTPGCPGF